MRALLALSLIAASLGSYAGTPAQIMQNYTSEAVATQPGFTPSAKRGEKLFRERFPVSEKMPACTSCHTDSPLGTGQHVVTGKSIRPLAVSANGERFGDPAKVEKWFARNCKEVVGRTCSPAEKADFTAYMSEVR